VTANYQIAAGTATIIAGDTDSGNHCDDCLTTITPPFPISLYDGTYTSAQVSSNGQLDFTVGDSNYANACLPDAAATDAIFPHWDDQMTDAETSCSAFPSGCGIFTGVTGTVGSRVYVVEWRSVYYLNGAALNYEVVFHENQPGTFDLVYGTIPNAGVSATAGVQKGTGSLFTQYESTPAASPAGWISTSTSCRAVGQRMLRRLPPQTQ